MSNWPISEVAEHKKERFLRLVEQLGGLRDIQFDEHETPDILRIGRQIPAENLPSNLIRAAVIFVDYHFGFPPNRNAFGPPAWVTAKELLPKENRGSLACKGFGDMASVEEGDTVVLRDDIEALGLHAGMAGMVRELHSGCGDDDVIEVEFGEPDDSTTIRTNVLRRSLRTPRPGDILEPFRR